MSFDYAYERGAAGFRQAAPYEDGDGPDTEVNFDDCPSRAERLVRALKLVPLRELWDYLNALDEQEHLFACDAKCHIGPTPYGGCSHPKKTFLSTRNSRRSTHVYLFWYYLLGNPSRITDNMLKGDMRKNLRPICAFGLNECNGHARNPGHQVCINPFHYQIVEPQLAIDKLVHHGVFGNSFPIRTRLMSVRAFAQEVRAALAHVPYETTAFTLSDDTSDDATIPDGPVVPTTATYHPHPAAAAAANGGMGSGSSSPHGPALMPSYHLPPSHHQFASFSHPSGEQANKPLDGGWYRPSLHHHVYMAGPYGHRSGVSLPYAYPLHTLRETVRGDGGDALVPQTEEMVTDDSATQEELASILVSFGTRAIKQDPPPVSHPGRLSRSSSSCGLQALANAAVADSRRV